MKRYWFAPLLCVIWIISSCSSATPATPSPPSPAATAAATVAPASPSPTAIPPTTVPTATLEPPSSTTAPTSTIEPTPPTTESTLPGILDHLRALGHASFRLDGPPTIYFDPTTLRDEMIPANIILISHEHNDHYLPSVLRQISTVETVIITNDTVAAKLKNANVAGEVRALKPGEETTVGDVMIQTVPAYNTDTSHHPKEALGLGFIVSVGGERLYFAGDTDRIPEMQDIECDVALLPIGGFYTMNIQEAAEAAADIGAKVVVPMHERDANPEEFRDLCDCTVVILKP